MRLGTRGSALARWQADHVADRLRAAGHPIEIEVISTKGDRILDLPLAEIGDKGLFTQELDRALLDGDIDLAVHSLKDLPTTLPEGLTLAAVSSRDDPADAFVAHPSFDGRLSDLPEGALIGTSSLRRQAQLLAWRPDLRVIPVRGNVPTRVAKLDASLPEEGGFHGLILAAAGLSRLDMGDRITERIDHAVMVPAVSQGALGIVTAIDNEDATQTVRDSADDLPLRPTVMAERALLRRLEGGCQVPVAGHATIEDGRLKLVGVVASADGKQVVRDTFAGDPAQADTIGTALAEHLLAGGAAAILAGIRAPR